MRGHLSLWLWVHGRFLVCDPSEIHGVKPQRCADFFGEIASGFTAGYTPKFHFQLRVGVKLCWLKSPEKKNEVYVFKNP